MLIKHNIARLFLLTSILFFSCKNDEAKYAQIERAIELGEQHPREALSLLDSIHSMDQLDERGFMLYQIAKVRAIRNMNDTISKQQTELISKAADFFEKEKNTKNAVLANYYAAIAYHSQANVEQELSHYLKAISYAEILNDSLMIGKALYNIGVMYYDQGVYDSTRVYLQKVTFLLNKYPGIQVRAYRLLAHSYYLTDDLGNALQNLDRGIPLLKEGDNSKFAYLYNTLYGVIYKRSGKYTKATNYLQKNMADTALPEIERVRTVLNLTEFYILSHQMDSATYYQQMIEPLLLNMDIKEDELFLFGYQTLVYYYAEVGNKTKAKEYLGLLKERQLIIDKNNEAETLFYVDKKNKKIEQLETAQKEYQTALYLLVVLIILVVGILVFVFIRIKLKGKKAINRQKEEIAKLSDEVKRI